MPLDVVRLRDSDLAAVTSGDEFRAAVLLWCASWHQIPAGSLPKDERALAHLAGFGRDMKGWETARAGAMRGWQEASDGRLYHPVIAEKAAEAWASKKSASDRGRKGNATRWGSQKDRPAIAEGSPSDLQATDQRVAQGSQQTQTQTQIQTQTDRQIDRSKASQPASQPSDLGWMDPSPATAPPPVVIASPAARRTTADLLAVCSAIYAPPDDRAQLDTLIALYTWDYVLAEAQDLAKGRPADKRRVFAREIGDRLAAKYDLSADDYARAGIPQPTKA